MKHNLMTLRKKFTLEELNALEEELREISRTFHRSRGEVRLAYEVLGETDNI